MKLINLFAIYIAFSQVATADAFDPKYLGFEQDLANHSLVATDHWGLYECDLLSSGGKRYSINCGLTYVDGISVMSRETFEVHDRAACSVQFRGEPDPSVFQSAPDNFENGDTVMRLRGSEESPLHFTERHEVYDDNGKKYTRYQLDAGLWADRRLLIDCTRKIGDQMPFDLSEVSSLLSPMFKIEENVP